jgi:hypothetical protein
MNFLCTLSYLSMKQCSLFCFVCQAEISQTTALHVTLLVSLEKQARMIKGALTWFVLRLFGAMVWKLLIIEPFFQ